jgi:predicted phage gp36 major capsid-like protein
VLRDPYGDAATGQVNLFYSYRVDYEILQSEAIVYGRVSNT